MTDDELRKRIRHGVRQNSLKQRTQRDIDRWNSRFDVAENTRRALERMRQKQAQERLNFREHKLKLQADIWNDKDAEYTKAYYRMTTSREQWLATFSALPFWPRAWRNPRTLLWSRLAGHIRHGRYFLLCGPDMKSAMIAVEEAVERWPEASAHLSTQQFRKGERLMAEILDTLMQVNHRTSDLSVKRPPVREAGKIADLTNAWVQIMGDVPAPAEAEPEAALPAPKDFDAQRGNMLLLQGCLDAGDLKDELARMLSLLEGWSDLRAKLPNDKRRFGDYWFSQIADACRSMATDQDLLGSPEARQGLQERMEDIRAKLDEAARGVSSGKVSSFMSDLSALGRQVR